MITDSVGVIWRLHFAVGVKVMWLITFYILYSFFLYSQQKRTCCATGDPTAFTEILQRYEYSDRAVAAVAARLTAQAPASASRASAAAVRATYVECVESVCGRESLLWFHNYWVTSQNTTMYLEHFDSLANQPKIRNHQAQQLFLIRYYICIVL